MSINQKPNRVLLTGGTGCVGHRVLSELLKSGYKVRATARPSKAHVLKDTYPNAGDQLEVYEMQDLVVADWTEPLKDVDAVVHVAAPVYHPGVTAKQIYDSAVVGTRRLIDAVGASGHVKRFVLTGSIGAFFTPDFSNVFTDVTFDENTFAEIDDFDPTTYPPDASYIASKTISDKVLWKAAEKYTNVDFTVVFPPCVYGAYIPTYPTPQDLPGLNANKFLYDLIKPDAAFPPFPVIALAHSIDIARAHVKALTAPRLTDGRKKRLIMCAGYMPWVDAVAHIKAKRPELAARCVDIDEEKKAKIPPVHFKLDTKLTDEVLGKWEKVKWEDLLIEVVDWLLDWEKKMGIEAPVAV